ncbi:MAG: LysM peptidoglycan-binding domain-containing protein, partial [Nitrospirae bacterium]|nr:LysM peptidoglycan-binding domain-containing protein [Nitrospirota bacterium]
MLRFSIILILSLLLAGSSLAETYKVKEGDNLYNISKKYKISVKEIKRANGLKSNALKIGMPITLPPRSSEKNKPLLAETKKH